MNRSKRRNLLGAGIAATLACTIAGTITAYSGGHGPGMKVSAGGVRAQNVDLAPAPGPRTITINPQFPKNVTINIQMRAGFVGEVCVTNARPQQVCTGDLLIGHDYTLDAPFLSGDSSAAVMGIVRDGENGNDHTINVQLNPSNLNAETHCVRLDGTLWGDPSHWSISEC